jgi:hypothetical protein
MLVPTFLALGATFYLAVHWLVGAVWITPLRRLMEGLTTGLPITAVAFFIIAIFGASELYTWVKASGTDDHASLFHIKDGSKQYYMVWTRFIVMNAVFIALWWFFRDRIIGLSTKQDGVGGELREKATPWAIAYLMVFGIGSTFFVWDLLLSLHVNWFSTMWGVYCFTSMVQTFLCVTILFIIGLRNTHLKDIVPKHILHDISTWMVGWSCFCAYIGFSQYMLIYYANLDEATFPFVIRTQNGYDWQLVTEIFLRWPLPFLVLMSQSRRTCTKTLILVSIGVLLGNWLTWSWIIAPAFSPNAYRSTIMGPELLVAAGFLGGTLLLAINFWKRHGIVAKSDPKLLPAINAEHLH